MQGLGAKPFGKRAACLGFLLQSSKSLPYSTMFSCVCLRRAKVGFRLWGVGYIFHRDFRASLASITLSPTV